MQPDPDLALIFRYIGPIIGFVSVVLAIMIPASIAYVVRGRRSDRNALPDGSTSMLEARLERIESAVDSIVIEVERISESQRFTAKLQSESQKAQSQLSSGIVG